MTRRLTDREWDTLLETHLAAIHERYGDGVAVDIGWARHAHCIASRIPDREAFFTSCFEKDGTVTHRVLILAP